MTDRQFRLVDVFGSEVRASFSDQRGEMVEDPVTGSLNASVAQWMLATGRVAGFYVVSPGTRLGRSGRVHVTRKGTATSGSVAMSSTS